MIVAMLETRNFSFTALGIDRPSAMYAMRRGWAVHQAASGAAGFEDVEDEVVLLELEAGGCARDGEVIS